MSDDTAKWHWAEGLKFALEGVKLLFILNGASAVAMLTFTGNSKVNSHQLVYSMVFFALGAASTVVIMVMAYVTQLHYGNAVQLSNTATSRSAGRFHRYTYITSLFGILFFLMGVVLAACGLLGLAAV